VEFVINNQGSASRDAACAYVSGTRFARDVLGDIVRCAPWKQGCWLLTAEGDYWVLNLHAVGLPSETFQR